MKHSFMLVISSITFLLLIASCTPKESNPPPSINPENIIEITSSIPATYTSITPTYVIPLTITPADTQIPSPTYIEVATGVFVMPTWTPLPTLTLRATPTRQPGPTPTAFPLPPLPYNPAGTIYYATAPDYYSDTLTHYYFSIDTQGQVITGPVALELPSELGFDAPLGVYPSLDGRYTVVLEPVMPGGIPHIINHVTGNIGTPYEQKWSGNFYGWHPDNQHFLFSIEFEGLWLINAENYEITVLAYPQGHIQGASISPNGQTVAFVARNSSGSEKSLWMIGSVGDNLRSLYDASYLQINPWKPDSTQLLYRGGCGGALCLYDAQTNETESVSLPFALSYSPVLWSPDGQKILMTGFAEGITPCDNTQQANDPVSCQYIGQIIYIFDLATGNATPLTEGIAPIL